MVDGLKLRYHLDNYEAWKEVTKLTFFTATDLQTGEVKKKILSELQTTIVHAGAFEQFKLIVKEVQKKNSSHRNSITYYLSIEGSLHKNHFGGSNVDPFTWEMLQEEINHIEKGLQLQPELAKIDKIEFGVNIPLTFPALPFLERNLISYKGCPFNRYNPDKNGVWLGYHCRLTQYEVKIYDKGLQYGLPHGLMRFELKFFKLQKLKKRGIVYLSNLKEQQPVKNLLELLLQAWSDVLLYDESIDLNKPELNSEQRDLLLNGRRYGHWKELKEQGVRMYNYQRSQFKKLVSVHGQNYHGTIRDLIEKTWEDLFDGSTFLGRGNKKDLSEFTIKTKGKNVQERVCLSCGRDISQQHPESKYCSARFVGYEAAHRCRNMASNPRNNRRRKIERITRRGVLFDIEPYLLSSA